MVLVGTGNVSIVWGEMGNDHQNYIRIYSDPAISPVIMYTKSFFVALFVIVNKSGNG